MGKERLVPQRLMALERFDERLVFKRVNAEYTRLLVEKGFSVPTVGGNKFTLSDNQFSLVGPKQ